MKIKAAGKIRHFRGTILGVSGATILLIIDLYFNLDFSEWLVRLARSTEKWEFDEIILCSVLAFIGMGIDLINSVERSVQKRRLHAARVEVMEKALNKTQHIVNNYLNEMLLFKILLDEHRRLTPEELARFESSIYHASEELRKIEKLEDLNIRFNTTTLRLKKNDKFSADRHHRKKH